MIDVELIFQSSCLQTTHYQLVLEFLLDPNYQVMSTAWHTAVGHATLALGSSGGGHFRYRCQDVGGDESQFRTRKSSKNSN